MADEIPAKVFNQWWAFYNENPFGPWRDNYHAAQLCAITVNRSLGKSERAVSAQDFMYESTKAKTKRREMNRQQETAAFITALKARAKPKNG